MDIKYSVLEKLFGSLLSPVLKPKLCGQGHGCHHGATGLPTGHEGYTYSTSVFLKGGGE